MNRRFTNSELSDWRTCRRKWWFTHYRKLAARSEHLNENREVGNVVHHVLAHGYQHNWSSDVKGDVAYAVFALGESHPDCEQCEPLLLKIREYSEKIVEGYIQWLEEEGADQALTLVGTETEVEYEISPGVSLLGKLDAQFYRDSDNAKFFMDHKVVQNLGDLPGTANIDTQFKFYMMLQRATIPADEAAVWCDGGILNMLRRVKRTGTAKPPFYGRYEVRHNTETLRRFWLQTLATVRDVLAMEEKLGNGATPAEVACYPSPRRECSWSCSFFSACPMVDDGSDIEGMLGDVFQITNPLGRYST